MTIETLKKSGTCFSYCRYAVFPQIPYVQDVLHALQLGEKHKKCYYSPAGAANWGAYIKNVVLVAAAVASKVLYMEPYDEVKARKIIAEAIMEFCPAEAKCLFNSAFVEAQEEFVGQPAPSRRASRKEILKACCCPECERVISEEKALSAVGSILARYEADIT